MLDATTPLTPADEAIAALTHAKPTILIWNKLDAVAAAPGTENREPRTENQQAMSPGHRQAVFAPPALAHPQMYATVQLSARTGAGIDALAQAVATALLGSVPAAGGSARLVSNPRHRDALRRAEEHLAAALAGWEQQHPTDLLGGDLTAALNALGEITGESVGDDLLDLIFSRFCIGK